MCLGVTAGAYVLTLFAVCDFMSQDLSVNKNVSLEAVLIIIYTM